MMLGIVNGESMLASMAVLPVEPVRLTLVPGVSLVDMRHQREVEQYVAEMERNTWVDPHERIRLAEEVLDRYLINGTPEQQAVCVAVRRALLEGDASQRVVQGGLF